MVSGASTTKVSVLSGLVTVKLALILNETDFALIFPYYDNAKSIIIYNERDYKIATIPLIEEQFTQKRTFWWVLILAVLLLVIGYMLYKHYKNKQSSTKNL